VVIDEDDKPTLPDEHPVPKKTASNPKKPASDVNAGPGDPTDGRNVNDWKSRYPDEAHKLIRQEFIYLVVIFLLSNSLIFATWYGCIHSFMKLSPEQVNTLKKYLFYSSAGMLGGVTFGIKYFYRVVARGYWNVDRRIWRWLSPLIAMSIAFIVGVLIDASFINTKGPASAAAFVSIGFMSGYFADEAVGKMYDIATVLFGRTQSAK